MFPSKKILISIIIVIFAITNSNYSENKKENLNNILTECAKYCERLGNAVLDIACIEKIEERIYLQSHFFKKNEYTYDYQLIKRPNKIEERRTLIRENGKEKHEKNAQLKTKRFKHKNIIFGPIGLLSSYWQQFHHYEILKEETIRGIKTIVIKAIPRSFKKSPHLYGKIWINKNDFSILKIEWNQNSLENFDALEETARKLYAEPRITMIGEYLFEKNGVRFPSQYLLIEEYISKTRKLIYKKSELGIIYKDYKFFTVEVETKYKD